VGNQIVPEGPHDHRFTFNQQINPLITKYRNEQVPSFEKATSREVESVMAMRTKGAQSKKKDSSFRNRIEPMTVYEPNWDYNNKSLTLCVPAFEKQCGRNEAVMYNGQKTVGEQKPDEVDRELLS
jgi:hypothetical protein